MEYSSDKKIDSKHSIKKRTKKLIWKSLLILASTIALIVLAVVEKRLFEKKNYKKGSRNFEKSSR